jgi:hypothetical protein
MTAAERQHLERERNRRAREAVVALSSFQGVDWVEQRELTRLEILNAIFLLSKWAMEGRAAVDEWRLTLPPDRRAYVANVFERMNIQLPFCSACGGDLRWDETGIWQRCRCRDGEDRHK